MSRLVLPRSPNVQVFFPHRGPLHHPTSRLNLCWLRHNPDTAWRRCSNTWRALKDLIRSCSDGGQPVRDAGQSVRGLAACRVSSSSIRVFLFQLEKGTTASSGLSLQDQRSAARNCCKVQTTANQTPQKKNTPQRPLITLAVSAQLRPRRETFPTQPANGNDLGTSRQRLLASSAMDRLQGPLPGINAIVNGRRDA